MLRIDLRLFVGEAIGGSLPYIYFGIDLFKTSRREISPVVD